MAWGLAFVILVIAAVLLILFLNRFYAKATPEVALIRTGAGGRKVVIDGGCLALPFLHRVERVNLRTARLVVERTGPKSLITADRLRVDIEMAFHVRVSPKPEAIVLAAQALGGRGFRSEELFALLEGKLLSAMQAAVASVAMDDIHEGRAAFAERVAALLAEPVARNGLELEAVSLTHFDQAPFAALDESNIFNAVGMRHLSEIVAENRKKRVETETEADIAVRQRQLELARQRLRIEQEQRQAEIAQKQEIERLQAESAAAVANVRAQAERTAEEARIRREGDVKAVEIERDRDLRRREMDAILEVEHGKIENAIKLAALQGDEAIAKADAETKKSALVLAMEEVQRKRELAAAARTKELALLKVEEANEVALSKIKAEVDTVLAKAKADAGASQVRAEAERLRMTAEAEGRSALAKAENALSEQTVRMRLEMHRLDRLPEIFGQLVKPAEKIESIRINQITGFGQAGPGSGASPDTPTSPFNQALDSILGMAVQFPTLKRLGEEIGVEMDPNLATRAADSIGRNIPKKNT